MAVPVIDVNEIVNKYKDDIITPSVCRNGRNLAAGYVNLHFIGEVTRDPQTAIKFCMDTGLGAKELQCPKCNKMMVMRNRRAVSDGSMWLCTGVHNQVRCQTLKSLRLNSWFATSRLTLKKMLTVTYFLCYNFPLLQIEHELRLAKQTCVDWASFVREIYIHIMISNSMKIGGPGKTVEIDESKFGRRKYYRGHLVTGQWVFGGVVKESGSSFLVPVESRDRVTLLEIIRNWIKPGTTVISDCWKAYDTLDDDGFSHMTVNHSVNFVDPTTGAHTNTIEGMWRDAKRHVPALGKRNHHFAGYLASMFHRKAKMDKMDPYIMLLDGIKGLYDPRNGPPEKDY